MSLRSVTTLLAVAGFGLAALAAPAAQAAPIKVGVILSITGPGASLAGPQRNTIALLPKDVAGHAIEYIVLDDASDSTKAVADARKLIDEEKVDALIGSSITPSSLAMIDVAAEKKVPMISLAASVSLIAPMDAQRRWAFKVPQNDSLMADAVAEHMEKSGVKTFAFIGFNDGYGDGWLTEITRAAKAHNLKLVDTERYARPDTSVTGQVLKIVAAKPDAVLIAGAGTPAALPEKTLRERGYSGKYYQTHGAANNDSLRVGGKDVEGTFLPVGPVVVAAQLPDSNPSKAVAVAYVTKYEAAYGAGTMSSFGAHAWDAATLLQAAVPAALEQGAPGTPAFRAALRDSMEAQKNLPLTHGIATLSPTDHNGLDSRARVMVTVQNGAWKLLP
jgi:branched-chain amino acid transport system substrate-binding protein